MPGAAPDSLPILVVEDNEDALELLVAYLQAQGHDARGATTATAGLAALARRDVRVLVTDYRLPDHSGAWLIATARERGLLDDVGLLICTAENAPEPVAGVKMLRKPLDLDCLDHEIETAMAAAHRAAMARFAGGEPPEGRLDAAKEPLAPSVPPPSAAPRRDRVELVLYVTDSMASLRAIRNLHHVLDGYPAERVRLSLCDLTARPLAGTEDRVSFTPMLVRHAPTPRESLLGDLRDADRIHDLLRAGAPGQEHE